MISLDEFQPCIQDDTRLRPFQRTGISWLRSRRNALLADEAGVGKSVQALMAIDENHRGLVVCPAVAKGVWENECKKWRPDLKPVVLSGKGNFRWPGDRELVVINYDILPENVRNTEKLKIVLIADECHYLKSGSKAARTTNFRAISREAYRNSGNIYGLSGSPLLNHPLELWHVLYSLGLSQEAFDSWHRFCHMFSAMQGRFGMVWGRPSAEVPSRLSRVMLRRLKKDVLKDLPPKTWQDIPAEIDRKTKNLCDEALLAIAGMGIDLDGAVDDSMLTRLSGAEFTSISSARKALAMAKIPAMLDVVGQFEANEEPLVVFSAHRPPIDLLGERKGWGCITGDTTGNRADIEQAFQRGELRGLAITIQSGGVSLTLTRASNALFVDQTFVPDINKQAEDRLARFGQTRGVLIQRLVADHRLDRRLAEILSEKNEIMSGVYGLSGDDLVQEELFQEARG